MNYGCDECSFKCQAIYMLKEHKQNAHDYDSVYLCSVCEKEFLSKDKLKAHVYSQHKQKTSPEMDDPTGYKNSSRRPTIYSKEERARNGFCPFWNEGFCRFEDLCKNVHEEIPACYFGSNCRRQSCRFYHDDRTKNDFLGWSYKIKFSYQEEDFPPLPSSQGRRW